MSKFKLVEVYTGYGENSVQSIKEIEGLNVLEVAYNALKGMREEMDGEELEAVEELFESYGTVEGSESEGWVESGEENMLIVLGEGSEMSGDVEEGECLSSFMERVERSTLGTYAITFK